MFARTLTLKVRYSDFVSITRSKTPDQPITKLTHILEILPELLRKTEVGKKPIRLIGVTVSNLHKQEEEIAQQKVEESDAAAPQMGLFSKES